MLGFIYSGILVLTNYGIEDKPDHVLECKDPFWSLQRLSLRPRICHCKTRAHVSISGGGNWNEARIFKEHTHVSWLQDIFARKVWNIKSILHQSNHCVVKKMKRLVILYWKCSYNITNYNISDFSPA